jgi:hypothetical protein
MEVNLAAVIYKQFLSVRAFSQHLRAPAIFERSARPDFAMRLAIATSGKTAGLVVRKRRSEYDLPRFFVFTVGLSRVPSEPLAVLGPSGWIFSRRFRSGRAGPLRHARLSP